MNAKGSPARGAISTRKGHLFITQWCPFLAFRQAQGPESYRGIFRLPQGPESNRRAQGL